MTSKIGTKDNAHAALRTQWRLIQFILRSYLQSLLLVTLGDVHDLEGCLTNHVSIQFHLRIYIIDTWTKGRYSRKVRTWGQALLKLVGLVGVLQDQRVEEAVASDLELDLLGLAVALNAGG